MRVPERLRETLLIGAVHAALVIAIWLASIVVYACAFATPQPLWLAIDLAVIAGCVTAVVRFRDVLGFGSLGPRKLVKLAAIVLVSIACVLLCQLAIPDSNGVWLDESNYLMTVRAGHILRDGLLPFNMRWAVPFFAGRWNVLPVDDMDAVKAINFGAFVVTGVFLVLLLRRLGVKLSHAIAAPVFLLCSYLGVYGAHNRLVLDPSNYALFTIMFHTLMRREHRPYFAVTLFVAACNAEKAVYWLPLFALVELVRRPLPWRWRDLVDVGKQFIIYCGPTIAYFVWLALYIEPSRLEANLCFQNLHLMSFSWLDGHITENVRMNNFEMLWTPFGPFSLYALLGFTMCQRWMRPIVLLLIPIFIQSLIACDTERMTAYTFIVYLPFGYVYLSRALAALPRVASAVWFTLAVALAIAERYLVAGAARLGLALHAVNTTKMAMSAIEILLVGGLIFAHYVCYQPQQQGDP